MKKIQITILMLLIAVVSFAQIKISALPTATGKGTGGFLPIVQGGVTRKITADSLVIAAKNYADSLKALLVIPINQNAINIATNAAAIQQRTDSLRNNAGILEAKKGGVFVPQFTLPTGGGAGTVTNVATGLGLLGGAITTTGTIIVDTSNASILSRQRAAATYQPTGSYLTANQPIVATATGDVTGTSSSSGTAPSLPLVLANVNSTPGVFGSASQSLTVTVNPKGLVTALSAQSIQVAESQVTNLVTDLAAKQPTISLTTTGTSGASTLTGSTLNIPNYATGGGVAGIDSGSYHFVTPLADSTGFILTRPNGTKDTVLVNLGPGVGSYVPTSYNLTTLNNFAVLQPIVFSAPITATGIPSAAIGPVQGIVMPHPGALNYGGTFVTDQEGNFFIRKNNGASAWRKVIDEGNIATYAPPSSGLQYNGNVTTLNSFVAPPTAFAGNSPTNNPSGAIGAVTGIALPHPAVAGYGGIILSDQAGNFFTKVNNTSTTWSRMLTDQNIGTYALVPTNGINFTSNGDANTWSSNTMYYNGGTNIPADASGLTAINYPYAGLSNYGNQLGFERYGKLYARNQGGGSFSAWKTIPQYLEATVTYAPPSIAASSSTTTTVSLTGALMGDIAQVSFSLSLNGLVVTDYVSSAGVITVVLFNPTASTITLSSGTLKVRAQ